MGIPNQMGVNQMAMNQMGMQGQMGGMQGMTGQMGMQGGAMMGGVNPMGNPAQFYHPQQAPMVQPLGGAPMPTALPGVKVEPQVVPEEANKD